MTCNGNGMDRSCTTSKATPASIRSNSARAFAVTPASISRTIVGLNPGWTSRR